MTTPISTIIRATVGNDELDILKQNFLNEIEFHHKHCEGEPCNVMVYLLFRLAKRAGIEFSKEEDYVI